MKATSTPTSSFESGWSSFQTDSGLVPVEQYCSLQAWYDKIHQEHTNPMKECICLEVKTLVLKYVS